MRKPHRPKRLNRHLWGVAADRTRKIVRNVMAGINGPGRYRFEEHTAIVCASSAAGVATIAACCVN